MNTYERASSHFEVLDHHFSKTIIGIEHFIIEDPWEQVGIWDIFDKLINSISVDVAEYTFTIEEGRFIGINFESFEQIFKRYNIG